MCVMGSERSRKRKAGGIGRGEEGGNGPGGGLYIC